MQSVWSDSVQMQTFPALKGDAKTGVLVIGGGLAGVLCTYFLQEAGADVMLVEAKRIGSGITKNTTAKITAQHGLIYDQLIQHAGIQKAKQYLEANLWAVNKYKTLCAQAHMSCGFEEKSSYVYTLKQKNKILAEVSALKKLGFPGEFVKDIPLPLPVTGAVKFPGQGQFNPLQFLQALSKDLKIYENTMVERVKGTVAETANGHITASKIIVATHYPILKKAIPGLYFMKLYQHRSYVLALENAKNVEGMYVDEAQKGLSFRNYKGLLLLGGGDHRTGKTGGCWEELRRFAHAHYPNATEKYAWATQDCMSLDSVPYIGQYTAGNSDIYVATGFNKWGMTSSMVSAQLLADMILGIQNKNRPVFNPARSMLKKQLFCNLGESTLNLLTPTFPRCPHMGCALKWNKAERTWDCPCHGSRFNQQGDLIDNPAQIRRK